MACVDLFSIHIVQLQPWPRARYWKEKMFGWEPVETPLYASNVHPEWAESMLIPRLREQGWKEARVLRMSVKLETTEGENET